MGGAVLPRPTSVREDPTNSPSHASRGQTSWYRSTVVGRQNELYGRSAGLEKMQTTRHQKGRLVEAGQAGRAGDPDGRGENEPEFIRVDRIRIDPVAINDLYLIYNEC